MSHSIYLLETQFQVLLRTVIRLQPLTARQGENSTWNYVEDESMLGKIHF
ncbi:hypothetical protein [Pilibacter termitis]|nr:hypothetical protein [Pilibacter termitis]